MRFTLPPLAFVLVWVAATLASAAPACPCDDASLCSPLTTPNKADNQLWVFSITPGAWRSYNYTYLTVVLPFYNFAAEDPALICTSHGRGVRVYIATEPFPLANLTSPTDQQAWVTAQVARAMLVGADGLNVDIESPIESPEQPALLTQLVEQLTVAMHEANPVSQVSFDVAWSPNDVDKRSYDYVGLSGACDVLFVMGYDERSQVWSGPCIAGANAGLGQTSSGLSAYLSLGIHPQQLVLGAPWYGRQYPCLSLEGNVCTIQPVPFEGCNCSDAVAAEIPLDSIPVPVGGAQWDEATSSPFFNYNVTTTIREGVLTTQLMQMWYDNGTSLGLKYSLARQSGLAGVGMWTGDFSVQTSMWAAFDAFFVP